MSENPAPGVAGIEEVLLDHDERLTELSESVDSMRDEVKDLLASPPASKPAPWNWKHLDGAQSAKLMEELNEWVAWINDRYGVTDSSRIYGCWYLHRPVVEELTACWIAWKAAYYGHKNPTSDAASWHDGTFWPMMKRIRGEAWGLSKCHADHTTPRPSFRESTDENFHTFLEGSFGAKRK